MPTAMRSAWKERRPSPGLSGLWACRARRACRVCRAFSASKAPVAQARQRGLRCLVAFVDGDRKSTRLNSSHSQISYAVFCLKKKKKYYNSIYYTDTVVTATVYLLT